MNYLQFETRVKLFKGFILLNLLDILSTFYCLQLGAVEYNPILRSVLGVFGLGGLVAVKMSVLVLMHLFFHHISKVMLIILSVGMGAIIINNLVTMSLLS